MTASLEVFTVLVLRRFMENSCYVKKQVKAHWYQRDGFARCADQIRAAKKSGS
jgi:hypothetical protein